jgi:hypothetical protein
VKSSACLNLNHLLITEKTETAAFVENQFEQSCTAIKISSEFPSQPVALFTQQMQNLYVDVIKKYENSKELYV